MDNEKLMRLKELAEKATPGPWIMDQNGEVYSEYRDDFPVDIIEGCCMEQSDAAYISAASPDVVLDLIADRLKFAKMVDHLAYNLAIRHGVDNLQEGMDYWIEAAREYVERGNAHHHTDQN